MNFRIWVLGLGFRVQCLLFRILVLVLRCWGLGSGGSEFRVKGLSFRVQGLSVVRFGFRVVGLVFRVQGLESRVSGRGLRVSMLMI